MKSVCQTRIFVSAQEIIDCVRIWRKKPVISRSDWWQASLGFMTIKFLESEDAIAGCHGVCRGSKKKTENTSYETKNVSGIGDKPHTTFRRNFYSTKGMLVKELPCELYIMP